VGEAMEPGQIVDTIFSVDEDIRYVGIVGPEGDREIKISRMRDGAKSLTPEEQDREFIREIPEIILGLCEKLEADLGKTRYSLLCFHRLTLMLFKMQEYVVVMSLEAGTFARPIFDRITHLLSLDQ
jgi:hypothetical protein